MDLMEKSLLAHKEWKGKIEITPRLSLKTKEDLSLAYTPGVAEPCKKISENPDYSYEYTRRGNLVAVITDGSAVLGLGDIGGLAGMPVMEGKCLLFKEFAGIDAFPLCINSNDVDTIVNTIELISDSFGGINLEDIAAPRCFEIEKKLIERLNIPVFHDDQHGTAVVVGAALINAAKCAEKSLDALSVVINGSGAAGIAISKLLISLGVRDILMVDVGGILNSNETYANSAHNEIASLTNKSNRKGTLADALVGADVFIGVSRPGLLTPNMIKTMAEKSIIFAMANPIPEIMPDTAKSAGAFIIGTGRSDFPNQINNLLVFPGIFKGALSVRALKITESMKLAAAKAIAGIIKDSELSPENIIPSPLDKSVAAVVSKAVADSWRQNEGRC